MIQYYELYFNKAIKNQLYNPVTLLLDIYPRSMKIYVHKKSCSTQMSTEALFIVAQTQNQLKCLSFEWKSKT